MTTQALWNQLRPQIIKEAKKLLKFCNVFELNDFINESYVAVNEALKKYNEFDSGMKAETYCIWYVRKFLYNMVSQGGEVVYEVYINGKFQFYLTNYEYRRLKRQLETEGFTVVSKRNSYNESELISNNNISIIEGKNHNGNGNQN
ncbi:MAG TPA: hypothetical protein PLJ17_02180 [Syntrophorhabdaceae bacterium]|nr:hypothetical protein [Caldisericia bacterium]HQH42577.1 hypothetical protein [Syntrophorhabdaceae bacterium]